MKINRIMQTAILLALILIIEITQGNSLNKSENQNQKTSENSKGPANNMLPIRNALGQNMKKNSILTTFPMKVKSCDQIAIFSAKYITDFGDYRLRKVGWFAINAHSASIYKDKDANQLIHHVLWANVKKTPAHLMGGRGCITIDGGSDVADISACFPVKKRAENLLRVIKDFYKCRMGDNLQPLPKNIVRKLIQTCGKNGKIISGKKHKKFKMSLKARSGNKWDANRMSYHHPEAIRVPGTPRKH